MYADILIQHGFSRKQNQLTYHIPDGMALEVGQGVRVPFQKKDLAGLVLQIHHKEPLFKTRDILGSLKEEKLLWDWQIQLAEWISEYYFCSKYDAYRLMLPKNIFRTEKKAHTKKQPGKTRATPEEPKELTPKQASIVEKIEASEKKTFLIHGVTGAGKTEIYKTLIKKVVQNGGQSLLLVPEISLTPQLLHYFETEFPDLAVIHSKVSEGQKAEVWKKVQSGLIPLVIGSRSALFSPFKNLQLIVMDEEHEWSYKQDQSPRYHARDVALKISTYTGAKVVLGSATPSLESYFNATQGNYELFTLEERIAGTPLPTVECVDMRDELRGGNFSFLSTKLEQKIRSTLAGGEQVLLFVNRRGSASSVLCRDCGYTFECPDCDLPLTYHARTLRQASLICHHCGKVKAVEALCPHCRGQRVKFLGLGTEKVETELKKLFPRARIARADRDTMSKKESFTELHKKLRNGEIDILIGTQMIGKGFDVAKLNLVGVLMADMGLHIPDFRSSERIFQLLTQVAGRAGRRKKQGEVVLQSYNPDHPSIFFSQKHDFNGFYEQEIRSRKEGGMPPFGRLVKLMTSDPNAKECENRAMVLKKTLEGQGHLIFAAPALLPRVKKMYQWNILIQGETPEKLIQKLTPEQVKTWRVDVDPQISV